MFEERFQAARTADAVLDFLNFLVREVFPARPGWRVVPQPFEKNFDLCQRESHLARQRDEEHTEEWQGWRQETKEKEKQVLKTQNKFYCNVKALNPAERLRHKQLTDKLIAGRKEIVETEKGYEFQYSPSHVSLAELADWVVVVG